MSNTNGLRAAIEREQKKMKEENRERKGESKPGVPLSDDKNKRMTY